MNLADKLALDALILQQNAQHMAAFKAGTQPRRPTGPGAWSAELEAELERRKAEREAWLAEQK